MEREILLNQIKSEEMKGIMNTKYSRIKEQKNLSKIKVVMMLITIIIVIKM